MHRQCLLFLVFTIGLRLPNSLHAGPPTVSKAEPAPEWEAKFANKEGWIGGDCVYSTMLSPERVLWLFGDTLIGTAKDGKREGAKNDQ